MCPSLKLLPKFYEPSISKLSSVIRMSFEWEKLQHSRFLPILDPKTGTIVPEDPRKKETWGTAVTARRSSQPPVQLKYLKSSRVTNFTKTVNKILNPFHFQQPV